MRVMFLINMKKSSKDVTQDLRNDLALQLIHLVLAKDSSEMASKEEAIHNGP